MDVKLLTLEETDLSVRSKNALQRAGVHTVGDMLELTEEALGEIRNLGAKSISEILEKIDYYNLLREMSNSPDAMKSINLDNISENKGIIKDYLFCNNVHIDALELLPAKAYNYLLLNGYEKLEDVIFLSADELMQIRGMDSVSAEEIIKSCRRYLRVMWECICEYELQKAEEQSKKRLSIWELMKDKSCREDILTYVRTNNIAVAEMGLSNRSVNQLAANDFKYMSDIVFLTEKDLRNIPNLGHNSISEISEKIKEYISAHSENIKQFVGGDKSAAINENMIKDIIVGIFDSIEFGGLSVNELISRINLPVEIPQEMVKRILGQLLSQGMLEYVDYRCYRIYGRFIDYVSKCDTLDERGKEFLNKRLNGQTLDEIGMPYIITRERVRQILGKSAARVRKFYTSETGLTLFDEDYYRYLYETYDFDCKECSSWFGVPQYVWNYFEIFGIKRGDKPLEDAIKDNQYLDAGMRLRIKNYINSNRIYIDGKWIEKQRMQLEPAVVKKFCTEDVTLSEFVRIFNSFLEKEDIPFDKTLYYTDEVLRTRKNRLADSRFLLWKRGEKFRYYDIDGQDYSELLETLDLGSYKNVELSTVKFVESYPELMTKYDIRDGYELHNLLKKVLEQDGAVTYPDIVFSKMPVIRFGTPDRDGALYSMMAENAPISMNDLCELIHNEYGYELKMIPNYIQHLMVYYSDGEFRIDHKEMSDERKAALKAALTDDFYFFDEIREIYRGLFPDADIEEINSYNLKKMGFVVNSKYVIQQFASAEEYFSDLLKREDKFDIDPIRKRFSGLPTYYQVYLDLRRNLEIIESEPDHFINFRMLERAGITKEMLGSFCGEVFDFVEDRTFFSIQSLKSDGFESELFELGFEDYFYANLLISDERFSWQKMFGTMILYKGRIDVMLKDFISDIIKREQKIDIYELENLLKERYGCTNVDRYDIVFRTRDAGIFFDSELQKFYADQEEYYREIDESGGVRH